MNQEFSSAHKSRFSEIRKKLSLIGSREETFISIELLFYETLNIAREYGKESSENRLLYELKQLEVNEYKATQGKFAKKNQRERTIKHFISSFKGILSQWEKAKPAVAVS
jgi:hypothetical protein